MPMPTPRPPLFILETHCVCACNREWVSGRATGLGGDQVMKPRLETAPPQPSASQAQQ